MASLVEQPNAGGPVDGGLEGCQTRLGLRDDHLEAAPEPAGWPVLAYTACLPSGRLLSRAGRPAGWTERLAAGWADGRDSGIAVLPDARPTSCIICVSPSAAPCRLRGTAFCLRCRHRSWICGWA